jgi:hypothetical protein
MEIGNNGEYTREGSNGSKSIIYLTWTTPLESPLKFWRLGRDVEDTGSDHKTIICETKALSGSNPIPLGERIRWDIGRMTQDDRDGAE